MVIDIHDENGLDLEALLLAIKFCQTVPTVSTFMDFVVHTTKSHA